MEFQANRLQPFLAGARFLLTAVFRAAYQSVPGRDNDIKRA
jgi:hypothetical protein